MLLARRLDERAWVLHRQGKIAFHISGIGHEAAQVGAAFALRRGEDWFAPYYRDLALMLSLGLTPREFMLGLMGKRGEPSSGARQMPSHWSLKRANVVSHSSPVATQSAARRRHWPGDQDCAATSGCADHDRRGLDLARRVVRGGQLGGGPQTAGHLHGGEQRVRHLRPPGPADGGAAIVADNAAGLGLPGISVDGMDVLEVYRAVAAGRGPRPRAATGRRWWRPRVSRMTPHSSDDDDRSYRSREEVEAMKAPTRWCCSATDLRRRRPADGRDDRRVREPKRKSRSMRRWQCATAAPYPPGRTAAYPVYVEDIRHG